MAPWNVTHEPLYFNYSQVNRSLPPQLLPSQLIYLVCCLLQFIILGHQLYTPIGMPLGKGNWGGITGENNILNKGQKQKIDLFV